MVRAILGVVVGLVTTVLIVVIGGAVGAIALGIDTVFAPESYAPSTLWVAIAFVLGLVAAILGGFLCALIAARGSTAPMVMAGIILVVGMALAALGAMQQREDPGPRPADATPQQIMENAPLAKPAWIAFVDPIIGAIGVVIGGKLRGGKAPAREPAS